MGNINFRRMSNRLSYKMRIFNVGGKILFLAILIFIIFCLYSYNMNIKPILYELGTSRAASVGQNVINTAIENVLSKNDALENDILNIEKDSQGKITAVIPDLKEMNKLKAKIAIEINEQMKKTTNSRISIPIGSLTGIPYLSNLGPRVNFNLIPYGKTQIDFKTSFTQAGINQTRHEVTVNVKLSTALLIANKQTTSTKIETTVPVSETVVIGDVPQSYTNFVTDEEHHREDAVNMLD